MTNLCKERFNCNGACCYSPSIRFSNPQIAQTFLKEAQKRGATVEQHSPDTFKQLQALAIIANPRSLLIIPNPDPSQPGTTEEIQVFGFCPFLENGECSIYDKPFRPPACEQLPIGSHRCNQARQNFKLDPIKI